VSDKTVLVTGSSRGIGRAIALRLARDGYGIVLHCRSGVEQAQEVAQQIRGLGRGVRVLQFDVADRATTSRVLLEDIEAHGCYYGVVCNAGIARDNAFPAMPGEDWDAVIHTNLDSFYNVLNPLTMPLVRRRKPGRIVTLSSVSGIIGNRGQVQDRVLRNELDLAVIGPPLKDPDLDFGRSITRDDHHPAHPVPRAQMPDEGQAFRARFIAEAQRGCVGSIDEDQAFEPFAGGQQMLQARHRPAGERRTTGQRDRTPRHYAT